MFNNFSLYCNGNSSNENLDELLLKISKNFVNFTLEELILENFSNTKLIDLNKLSNVQIKCLRIFSFDKLVQFSMDNNDVNDEKSLANYLTEIELFNNTLLDSDSLFNVSS